MKCWILVILILQCPVYALDHPYQKSIWEELKANFIDSSTSAHFYIPVALSAILQIGE